LGAIIDFVVGMGPFTPKNRRQIAILARAFPKGFDKVHALKILGGLLGNQVSGAAGDLKLFSLRQCRLN
jgi:hypothetical protein